MPNRGGQRRGLRPRVTRVGSLTFRATGNADEWQPLQQCRTEPGLPVQKREHMGAQAPFFYLSTAPVTLTCMKPLHFITSWWEWIFCTFTLLALALFLTGYDLLGLNGPLSTLLAVLGGLIGAILSFIAATLIFPIIALITGAVTALIAAVTGLLGILIGGIFTPIAALFAGWVTSIFTWVAGTWLGTLLMPVYSVLAPIVLKISPWITVSKSAGKALKSADKVPFLKRLKRRLGLSKS